MLCERLIVAIDALRRGAFVVGASAGVVLATACVQIGPFACERDTQCERDGAPGICVDPGFCASPTSECPSGFQFVDGATPSDLAGTCTPFVDATGTTTGEVPDFGDDASVPATTDSTTDAASDDTTGDFDCGDHPCACAVQAAAGEGRTCVLRTDGTIVCWGVNEDADLGLGEATAPIPWPQSVLVPPDLDFARLVSGNHHMCAATSDDELWCWGRNASFETTPDQVGDIQAPIVVDTPLPLGVFGLAPQHTCIGSARTHELRCYGGNQAGELGSDERGAGPFMPAVPGTEPIEQLALGRDHSCARIGGRVWCWGADDLGQLGVEPNVDPSAMPLEVELPADAISIFGGRNHTCAVLDDAVTVSCWGAGEAGQVGDGMATDAPVPTATVQPAPAPIVSASGRLDTSCGLLENGDIWCWGGTTGFELGADVRPRTQLDVPMRIEVVDELPEPIVDFTTGLSHLCAWSATGRLWCWGADDEQQLGPIDPPLGHRAVEIDLMCGR